MGYTLMQPDEYGTIEPFVCGGNAAFLSNYLDHLLQIGYIIVVDLLEDISCPTHSGDIFIFIVNFVN